MYDIIIIGSGPAGLTAAIYASRARLRTLVLERDTMGAGQIAVTEQVDNYPGLLHIGGYELGEKFREHAESLGASICENDVERLTKQDGVFQIALADGTTVSAKSVIYAAGTSYRKLDVPGAELPGVSYCATCDGAFYQGKTVAVIGGGRCPVSGTHGKDCLSGTPPGCFPCQCSIAGIGKADGKYCSGDKCSSNCGCGRKACFGTADRP